MRLSGEIMKRLLGFGIILAVSAGCAPLLVGAGVASSAAAGKKTPAQAVEINKKNLSNLTYGIGRNFADEVMGKKPIRAYRGEQEVVIPNPYKTEKFSKGQKNYDVDFYVTDIVTDDDAYGPEELTPLVFTDGILAGWGWKTYNEAR